MRKNIMVMVFSDVAINNDGTARKSVYEEINKPVETTNESAVRYLQQDLSKKGEKLDKIYAFATQTVQQNIQYKDKNKIWHFFIYHGKSITHLNFIKKRLEDILTETNWHVLCEPITESADVALPMDQTLWYTLQMADTIQKDVRQLRERYPKAEIVLHADCTGGPRHAIMMLLDIIRLLQYAHLQIGKILYSNWLKNEQRGRVETINDVFDFYNLVAGAEEFVNFGSVQDIRAYFHERITSEPLDNLLLSMADFADEVKLCRRWRFTDAAIHLRQSLQAFEQYVQEKQTAGLTTVLFNQDERLNDLLMFQLLPQLHQSYGLLLQPQSDILALISWCLQQGLLQQALTLYTEGLPDYLFQKGFISFSRNKKIRATLEEDYAKNGKEYDKHFYFLNHYERKENKAARKKEEKLAEQKLPVLEKKLKQCFCTLIQQKASAEEAREQLIKLDQSSTEWHIQNINRLADIFALLAEIDLQPNLLEQPKSRHHLLLQLLLKIYWDYTPMAKANWKETPLLKKRKQFINFFKSQIPPKKKDGKEGVAELAGGIGQRWSYNVRLRLFRKNMHDFELHVDAQQFYHILDDAAVIRRERNHSNHAKNEAGVFLDAKDLTHFMKQSLARIKLLSQNV